MITSKKKRTSKRNSNPTKRIAEAIHRNKIDLVETIENRIGGLNQKVDFEAETWLIDIRRGRISENRIRQTMDDLHNDIVQMFVRIGQESHHDIVGIFLDALPRNWFKALLPPETSHLIERDATENILDRIVSGELDVETPTELLADGNLSDEEKNELIEKLIFPPPSLQKVARLIAKGDAQTNVSWHDRFEKLSRKITDKTQLFRLLSQQFADGKNIDEIRREIQPVVSNIKSSAKRIARTEGMRIAERIQRETWDALGDMMVGAQIVAIKDQNTRPAHATRSGNIYYKKPTGNQLSLSDIPDLPDEPNCRCYTTPVLAPPEELENDPRARREFANANGTKIADPVGYEDWFSGASVANRQRAVGKKRYNEVNRQLGATRQPEWSDFINADGELLTLDQIKAETASARQFRKHQVRLELRRRRSDRIDVSRQGFLPPTTQPTLVFGQTFSGKVDVANPASLIGEIVRSKVARGVQTESQVREIGKTIRQYIESQEISDLNRFRNQLDRAIEKLQKRKRLSLEQQVTWIAANFRRSQLIEEIAQLRRKRFLDIMNQIRDFGSPNSQPTKRGSDPDGSKLFDDSQRFFPTDWINRFHETPLKIQTGVDRGFFNFKDKKLAISTRPDKVRQATTVHEMWHFAQLSFPKIRQLESELYKRRTKRSKLKLLSGSSRKKGKEEFGRRDSWFGHRRNGNAEYMGRDYGNEITELGTIAIESILFGVEPIENEKEVYDLTLGLLAVI